MADTGSSVRRQPVTAGLAAGDLVGMNRNDVEARLDLLQRARAQSIRVDFSWASVQPTSPTTWNWGNLDAIVHGAHRRGMTVLPVIGYTPAWARMAGCWGHECPPRDVEAFAGFASAAVQRYRNLIDTWEIWNEPNTGAWRRIADVSAYARLLQASSAVIRRQQPDAVVLVGGMAPTETVYGEGVSPEDFLATLYDSGLAASFDGVAVHPYSFPALPGEAESWSGWSQMLRVREVMVAAGDAGKGVYITEMGAPTGGNGVMATSSSRRYSSSPAYVDETLQAHTVQAVFSAARPLPWIRAIYWYGLVDLPSRAGSNEGYFGLLRVDGSRKPAYEVWLRAVADLQR
jgi:hypothetical protein